MSMCKCKVCHGIKCMTRKQWSVNDPCLVSSILMVIYDDYTMHALIWCWYMPWVDAHLWWCKLCVQWKQRSIICSVFGYDDVYKDVHEQCVIVIYIQGWFDSNQSLEVISSRSRVWYVTGPQVRQGWQDKARKGGRSLLLLLIRVVGRGKERRS